MLTRYLVQARDCYAIDPDQIQEAGGQLIAVGRLEEDGTVTVDVDVKDPNNQLRLGKLFAAQHRV